MRHSFTIHGSLPGLNEYISAERGDKGKYKAANLKKKAEILICYAIKEQLNGVKFTSPVSIHYRWVESSKRRDKDSDISKDEFIEWTNGGWSFAGESKKRTGHPAPFPIELPTRCIKLFSFVGDTVFDPFVGSGTTLIACAQTGRKGIGVEIDAHYCEIAKQRLV